MKTKFVLIGYGWRAEFYNRIAKLLPDRFEITAQVLRTEERASEVFQREHIITTTSLEEALDTQPDFVILCVPKAIVQEYLVELMKRKVPILCETPPSIDETSINQLWEDNVALEGRVQVAEQYFLQPYYASVLEIIEQGYLGEVSNVTLSAVHGYHAVSVIRKMLDVKFENCKIIGKRFEFDVVNTSGRKGFDTSGMIKRTNRDLVTIEFANGKVGFLDFSGEQYFSPIRKRRWNIQGLRGEINNDSVCYLNKSNTPIELDLRRVDIGINNISEWSHRGYSFLDNMVYENPYYPARINDDEIAVASCLDKMKEYVSTGKEFYPLRDALQDAYIAIKIQETLEKGEMIVTENQKWGVI